MNFKLKENIETSPYSFLTDASLSLTLAYIEIGDYESAGHMIKSILENHDNPVVKEIVSSFVIFE
jgi:hypothetical protein